MAVLRNEKGQVLPGQVLNPNGRPPKEWTMAGIIEQALEEVEERTGKTFKELIAKRLAHLAVSGDMQAIKEINDRMDGKPRQNLDHTTNGKEISQVVAFHYIKPDAEDNTDT